MVAYVQLALFLLVTCGVHETEQNHFGCHRLIMASHLKNLTDLIDSQMETSCLRSFEYVDERELGNTECFLKAAYHPLKYIIDNINFTSNTPNYLKLHLIKDLYLELARCIKPPNDKNKKCIKTFSLTAQQTLQLVHKYFSQAKQFLSKNTFTDDCSGVFQKCSESQEKEIVSPEKHTKKSEPRNIQGTSVTYVVIPSVLGILLALGGLLFYLHKSRILRKRQTQQMGNNVERTEEQRSLSGGEGHLELQIQREV